MISTDSIENILGLGYSLNVSREVGHAKIVVKDDRTGIELQQMLPLDSHIKNSLDNCVRFCTATLTTKLLEDKAAYWRANPPLTDEQVEQINEVFVALSQKSGREGRLSYPFSRNNDNTYWVSLWNDERIYMDVSPMPNGKVSFSNMKILLHSLYKGKEREKENVEKVLKFPLSLIKLRLEALGFIEVIGKITPQ